MSGSMREALKALNITFAAASVPHVLPNELLNAVESFLERYDDIDDHDAQRFHDDLHALYLRHVAGQPEKHGAFLSALRLLRPAITGETRLKIWWDLVVLPTVDGVGHKRHEMEDARDFVLSILVYDSDDDHDGQHARISALFTNKLLDAYLAHTNGPPLPEHTLSPENEFVSHELESLLVTFGRKMPKALFLALDSLFVQKQHRTQALTLLSAFVRLQPPHLHLVLETQLIQHLEKCLLIDTCALVIDLALVVLIMLLPHICVALTSDHHLEKMFLIYCRILCWDRLGTAEDSGFADQYADSDDDDAEEADDEEFEQAWEQVQQSAEYQDSSPPTLIHYFTFLYGLFPLNFTSFLRKPRKYLKSLNFPGARDFDLDQALIQNRTEPYRKVHLLHPNMFTTTIEDELSENRWSKSDPADVVIDCMDLCVAISPATQPPGPPPAAALPPVPEVPACFALDEDSTTVEGSHRQPQSTSCIAGSEFNTPEALEMPSKSKSIKSVKSEVSMASPLLKGRDMMDSPTLPATKEGKRHEMLTAQVVTAQRCLKQQPSLDNFVHSVAEPSSPATEEFRNHTIASLQREIMLLRNDLNFERYLKLQHLGHIGQLQRKHIKEATAEAETQNLINSNKTLKARLTKANDLYAQLKKETLTSRSQSKKWETELSAKVRTYKDIEKSWHSNEGSLRFELQRIQNDYDQLKQIVEKAEAQQLKAQQRTRALECDLESHGKIQRDLEAAQEKIVVYEGQTRDLRALLQERIDLRNDLEVANMRLNSREQEREKSFKAYERHIMELEARLQMSERNSDNSGQLPSAVQHMLDSTLATSNAKMQQLKKTHYHLLEQYTELQMKYHELEGQHQAEIGQGYAQARSGQAEYRNLRPGNHLSSNSRYASPLSIDVGLSEEGDYLPGQRPSEVLRSPTSVVTPTTPGHPPRLDALQTQKPHRSQTAPLPYPGFGGAMHPDYNKAYDTSWSRRIHSPQSGNAPHSRDSGSFSIDTEGSSSKEKKNKVDPKSEVRYYGRGGAQNIGKKKDKDKDNDAKKSSSSKSGGFRGFKGIL